jgi:hypothetical protein
MFEHCRKDKNTLNYCLLDDLNEKKHYYYHLPWGPGAKHNSSASSQLLEPIEQTISAVSDDCLQQLAHFGMGFYPKHVTKSIEKSW